MTREEEITYLKVIWNDDLISRGDAIEAIFKVGHEHVEEKVIPLGAVTDYSDAIKELSSAEAVHIETYRELYEKYVELKHASAEAVQLRQTDTLIIASALRCLAEDTERHPSDRTRAEELRKQFLRYGASMCHSADGTRRKEP